MLIVHKYGGSSLSSTAKIVTIAEHLKTYTQKGNDLVVVASAMGKTTNNLANLAYKISSSPNKRELDMLMSTGEVQTAALLAIALNNIGVKAVALSGRQAGIVTTDHFSRAFIKKIDNRKIKELIKIGYIVVVAGFQGITEDGQITTLGRGGSDTTAVALSASLNCSCEIYTDVEGVFTTDPRLYREAKKLKTISYNEMLEMAINGAKVLETRSVELAKMYNIKLYIGKTLEKEKRGTFVMKRKRIFEEMEIKALAIKDDISVFTLETSTHFKYQDYLLNVLSGACENFEMFNQMKTKNSNFISLSGKEDCNNIEPIIKNNKLLLEVKVSVKRGLVRITLIGTGLATHKYFIKKTISLLNKHKVGVHQVSLCETSLAFTIDKENKQKTIKVLCKEFNL
jgi:aspartate kinase